MKIKKYSNDLLPEFLMDEAYIYDSPDEFALPEKAALKYLAWCKEQNILVDGFEVWKPTFPHCTIIVGAAYDGDIEFCISMIPKVIANLGPDIIFNIWTVHFR